MTHPRKSIHPGRIILFSDLVQIDIYLTQFPLLAPFPQLRKNPFNDVIPLGMHVVERDADYDSDDLSGCGHDNERYSCVVYRK